MKIAIFSDVHGNAAALDAVVEDIKSKNVQMILCLGDIALGGYDPNHCVDVVSQITNGLVCREAKAIAGETDIMLANHKRKLLFKGFGIPSSYKDFAKHDAKILNNENFDFLSSLPTKLEITVGTCRIFACHGTIKSISEGINYKTSVNHLERMVKNVQADIIVSAHSHIPCVFYLPSGKTVLNVGSVGYPNTEDKRATYAVIDLQNQYGDYSIDFFNIDYDINYAIRRLKRLEFPNALLRAKTLENL